MKFFLLLLLSLLSVDCETEEFNYRFNWLNFQVSHFSLNIDSDYLDNEKKPNNFFEYSIRTMGPLKVYRDYSSSGKISFNNNLSWEYFVSGTDRGLPEEKHITFSYSKPPIINKFLDDKGQEPIIVESIEGDVLIDPFSILLLTIKKIKSSSDCSNTLTVYDGKRIYSIEISRVRDEFIGGTSEKTYKGKSIMCQFKIKNHIDNKNTGNINKRNWKVWPFKDNQKLINIWFGESINFAPVKFEITSPIGKIKGSLIL
jgi:hypothetical protein